VSVRNTKSGNDGDGFGLDHVTLIGVVADPAQHDVVREFFELFKTPWEFYKSGRTYDVVLCAGDWQIDEAAGVVLLYAGTATQFDGQQYCLNEATQCQPRLIRYREYRIPIYGDCLTFPAAENSMLTDLDSQASVAYRHDSAQRTTIRIGYDLFSEIRKLLTVGQPVASANIPTLELHIAFLRDLISECRVSLIEIPAVPEGYRFIACLTHDVDHPSIRRHKWDHTAVGFLYRAVFGSVSKLMRGRMSMPDVARNLRAALSLPLVYLGLAKDFWGDFGERYLDLEKGIRSTFFVIPFQNMPGNMPGKRQDGSAPKARAAQYGAEDIAGTIRQLTSAGCEVGLHGIDAWCDTSRGQSELAEIRRLTGVSEIGVRMHWLYHGEQSPALLEQAEAAYDSSVGYNETVGYRAGTTQAYKPLAATHMLELPLHVMDTALFYPAYLGLSPMEAREVLLDIAANATKFGGCITINWHDRSLAPERLWDLPYRDLLQDLKSRGAWFATAGETVSWFRKRRSVIFESSGKSFDEVCREISAHNNKSIPGLRLRINNQQKIVTSPASDQFDCAFDEGAASRMGAR
jgi:peptidoglycan/xylan/chitin deacetylase (PgdA/CDA1 family)